MAKRKIATRPLGRLCDWCGPDVPTPAVVAVTLTTIDAELLDSVNLCESCAERPIVINKLKSLDSAD